MRAYGFNSRFLILDSRSGDVRGEKQSRIQNQESRIETVPIEQRETELSRYVEFTRAEWARLRDATPLPLSEAQLRPLAGVNERVSVDEVTDIYLPLSRLLNLHVAATQTLHATTSTFLGTTGPKIPYVIGVGGSVAVG